MWKRPSGAGQGGLAKRYAQTLLQSSKRAVSAAFHLLCVCLNLTLQQSDYESALPNSNMSQQSQTPVAEGSY